MTKKKRQQRKKNGPLHPMLKMYSGFKPTTPDVIVRQYFDKVFPTEIEKPCGILQWCPYGPLVEEFPLHGEGEYRCAPLAEPSSCAVFGHDCPAFYVAEPFSDPDAVAENCLCDECRAKRNAAEVGDTSDIDPTSDGDVK